MPYKEIAVPNRKKPVDIMSFGSEEDLQKGSKFDQTDETDDVVPVIDTDNMDDVDIIEHQEELLEEQEIESDSYNGDELVDEQSEQQQEAPKKKAPAKRKKSRSAQRIKDLLTQTQALEARLAEKEQALEQYKKSLDTQTKSSKETLKNTLETSVSDIRMALKRAMEEGDTDGVLTLQEKLFETQWQLKNLNEELAKTPDVQEQQQQQQPQRRYSSENQPNPYALSWIEDHPEFKTDAVFQAAAIVVNNTLIAEGLDPNTEEFYDEVSERLSKRFPEYIYSESDESDDDSEVIEEKPAITPVKKVKPSQTVAGANRSLSTKGVTVQKKPQLPDLSPEQREVADRFGMDYKEYALYLKSLEEDKSPDGYKPIKIIRKN